MYNFFIDNTALSDGICTISGKDYNHIKNVLRMKPGEEFLVSCDNKSNLCKLLRFENDTCIAEIICEDYQETNLKAKVILFILISLVLRYLSIPFPRIISLPSG